jgi:hypothetical protein
MNMPASCKRDFTGRVSNNNNSTTTLLTSEWMQKCIIFLLGIVIGSVSFGSEEPRLTTSSSSCLPLTKTTTTITTKQQQQQQQQQQLDETHHHINKTNGWQSIDVFYGSNEYVESQLPSGQKWFSQAAQEQAVLSLLRNKRGGFFIDLASNDATFLSNSYILERDYGWQGLCIEPNPVYWYNLTHYRPNCQLVGAVVGRTTMEQVPFRYSGNEHGGIAGDGFDNGKRWKQKSTYEYTISLLDLFQRYQVPKVVDYLSLDVEGAEGFIMSAFPLKEYRIKLLTVERPKKELCDFLESHGYKNIQRLSSWGETLWAHTDFLGTTTTTPTTTTEYNDMVLDQSHLEDFHAKKQKELPEYSTIVKSQTSR